MICEHFECIQYCQSCFPYSSDLSYKRINDYKFPKTMKHQEAVFILLFGKMVDCLI